MVTGERCCEDCKYHDDSAETLCINLFALPTVRTSTLGSMFPFFSFFFSCMSVTLLCLSVATATGNEKPAVPEGELPRKGHDDSPKTSSRCEMSMLIHECRGVKNFLISFGSYKQGTVALTLSHRLWLLNLAIKGYQNEYNSHSNAPVPRLYILLQRNVVSTPLFFS